MANPKENQSSSSSKYEVNIIDILLTLARYKKIIITIVVSITLTALIISLLWPATYKSSATILPPAQESGIGGGALGGLVGSMMQLSFGAGKISSEAVLTVLTSRTIKEEMISRFNLMDEYNVKYVEHAIKKLDNSTDISEVREGGFGFNPVVAISINVTDRNPELARDMVNFYLSKADSVANVINTRNARESLELIESRFEQNQREMAEAEDRFREFQETHGIIELEEQTRVIVNQVAALKTKLVELDIQIEVIQQSVSGNQPELRNLIRTRDEVRSRIDQMIIDTEETTGFNIMPSVSRLPQLGLEYLRLYRDVVVQNKVYENLYPQYVHQKMTLDDQRRNIQIVDEASLPTYKDSPKRALIVLGGMLFSIFLSFIVVFYKEMMRHSEVNDPETYQKIQAIKQELAFRRSEKS